MSINYRNAHSKNISAYVDCEIEHKKYGWIPFTARNEGDTAEIYQKIVANISSVSIAPSPFHEFFEGEWILNVSILDSVKNEKTIEINKMRDNLLVSGFEYNGNFFDSDEKSIQRITGLVTQTLLNSDFNTAYITKDNATIYLNAIQLQGLGEAASAHEANIVFKARALKDAVLAATTVDEVEAVKW